MGAEIRILLADASENFLRMLRRRLTEEPELTVVAAVRDGQSAYERTLELRPDVLVMDVMLPGVDGLNLLRRLKRESLMPPTVVLASFLPNWLGDALCRLGVADFLAKPCLLTELTQRIRCAAEGQPRKSSETEAYVREALLAFGIPANLDGYRYLRYAVSLVMDDRELLRGITKVLYPAVARRFGTTSICVERSMRSAIRQGWERGDAERRALFFGSAAAALTGPPGNAKFLSTMVEFLQSGYENVRREKR